MLDGNWHKSTYSGDNGACVETRVGDGIEVRDTKDNKVGPVLHFDAEAWMAFVREVKANA